MATIRLRGNSYQVQIRKSGTIKTKSFKSKSIARKWAQQQETKIELGLISHKRHEPKSFREILSRYLDVETPKKSNPEGEAYVIRSFLKCKWVNKSIDSLRSIDIAEYRDWRLRSVKPSTVHRHFAILKHACRVADREWDWETPIHLFERVQIKKSQPRPIQRISDTKIEKLINTASLFRNETMGRLITLAVETALRRSELLSLSWDGVDFERLEVNVHKTKNGFPRVIPINIKTLELLKEMKKGSSFANVFQLSPNAVRLSFNRIRKRSRLENIRFHDLRHEGISRFFEMGLTLPEVASLSGHRTLSQLSRYAHPRISSIHQKLLASEVKKNESL